MFSAEQNCFWILNQSRQSLRAVDCRIPRSTLPKSLGNYFGLFWWRNYRTLVALELIVCSGKSDFRAKTRIISLKIAPEALLRGSSLKPSWIHQIFNPLKRGGGWNLVSEKALRQPWPSIPTLWHKTITYKKRIKDHRHQNFHYAEYASWCPRFWPFLRSPARAPTINAIRGTVAIKGIKGPRFLLRGVRSPYGTLWGIRSPYGPLLIV